MQLYQCHKKVRAFKLKEVDGLRLKGEGETDFVDVSPQFVVNHNALIKSGCYVVVYEDGFISCSPVDVFEKGYKAIEDEEPLEVVVGGADKEPAIDDGESQSLDGEFVAAEIDATEGVDKSEQNSENSSTTQEPAGDNFAGDVAFTSEEPVDAKLDGEQQET